MHGTIFRINCNIFSCNSSAKMTAYDDLLGLKYIPHHQDLLFLCFNVLAGFLFFSFFHATKTIDVSVSSLLHLCHTLPAKKDLKKTVEFDIGFAIARIWSTASNSMNSLNTANLTEIYTVCKLFMSALCAKKVQTFTFVLIL